jgi:hypothetical protein
VGHKLFTQGTVECVCFTEVIWCVTRAAAESQEEKKSAVPEIKVFVNATVTIEF